MGCNNSVVTVNQTSKTPSTQAQVIYNKEILWQPDMWVIEDQDGESGFVKEGIEIKNYAGVSIWFKPKLKAPIKIEYTITMLEGDTRYDRISDLNALWMAHDPNSPDNLFAPELKRTGRFSQYHHFKLYYAGMGVHNNTKTRFRRYDGNIERPLLPEHDLLGKHLLEVNTPYRIKIISTETGTQIYRNNEIIYDIQDEQAYTQGWFAFRSYRSHQLITDFQVTQLVK